MASRQTFSVRLSADEKVALQSEADELNMSLGEYARYKLTNSRPHGQTPLFASATAPAYDVLVSQVETSHAELSTLSRALNNMASSDQSVAAALDQARAALGPREE